MGKVNIEYPMYLCSYMRNEVKWLKLEGPAKGYEIIVAKRKGQVNNSIRVFNIRSFVAFWLRQLALTDFHKIKHGGVIRCREIDFRVIYQEVKKQINPIGEFY